MKRDTHISANRSRTHPAHERLLQLKLQGALHLAKVLETHPSENVRLKAAMTLARLAIPTGAGAPAADEPESEPRSVGDPVETPDPSGCHTTALRGVEASPSRTTPPIAPTTSLTSAPRPRPYSTRSFNYLLPADAGP